MTTATENMTEAIREVLSPEAIALIVAYLDSAECRHPGARREVRWLVDQLTAEVGGPAALSDLYAEIGV